MRKESLYKELAQKKKFIMPNIDGNIERSLKKQILNQGLK